MNLPTTSEHRARVEEFQRRNRIGLLTMLFTDIVGSTKLKQDLGDTEAVLLIQQHHATVRELLKDFNEAQEIDNPGDSFFLVFAKPSDAVKYSLLLQASLRVSAKRSGPGVFDRIGVHVGEVFVSSPENSRKPLDLYGIQVDSTARVMGLAQPGQILMSRFAFDSARQVLKGQDTEGVGQLSWLNHGPYLMKGLEDPLEICEVGETNEAPLFAPPNSEKAVRYSLPGSEPVLGWRPAVAQIVPNTKWILEQKLGEGGFGEVWLGRHEILKELRVFKFCFRADRARSLKRELTLFRLLKEKVGRHPNIVNIDDVYLDQPPYYLMMGDAGDKDLKSWCQNRGGEETIPLEIKLDIMAQIADGLQAAHECGVIHRDIKPSNILISDSQASPKIRPVAKLTDFGVGQVTSEEALTGQTRMGFTQTMMLPGAAVPPGTLMYMAPEVIAGKPATALSDIYSLGVVLYQFLAGDFSRPLTIDWGREIADPLLKQDLEKCFAGNPVGRFASAGQLASQLRHYENRLRDVERERGELASRSKEVDRVARTVIGLQHQKAEELFAAGDSPGALAYLALTLRANPENRLAVERALFALTQRNFAMPVPPDALAQVQPKIIPRNQKQFEIKIVWETDVLIKSNDFGKFFYTTLEHDVKIRSVARDRRSGGLMVATLAVDDTIRIWDGITGQLLTGPAKL